MKRLALAALSATLLIGGVSFASASPGDPGARSSSGPAATSADKRFAAKKNLRIKAGNSAFGRMLFSRPGQAIYVFDTETSKKPRCYGECARQWPPVLTYGRPKALKGVSQRLLGRTKRRGGAMQVTYNGKPLYYYHNEQPGQVFCHNVFLNGGLWQVIAPSGKVQD
jgi:predicted lipoprotein with Yx(FWY)xxD motif